MSGPWLALGMSRSNLYRRRAKARHEAALALKDAAPKARRGAARPGCTDKA